MSEVIQCDVCERIADPVAPRRICDEGWLVVDDGRREQHICSTECLLRFAQGRAGVGPPTTPPPPERGAVR